MNTIRLMGGLGNQMFQYALGRVQQEHGIEVLYDLTWFDRGRIPKRLYTLDKFEISISTTYRGRNGYHKYVTDKKKGILDLDLLLLDNTYFEGYWQYLAYYKDYLPIFEKEFRVKPEFYSKEYIYWRDQIKTRIESVAIHVRRGDYIGHNGFHELPFSYYLEALQNTPGSIFIFSDDIPWCKDTFKESYFDRDVNFAHCKDYLDLELMSFCNHNIISHSTFSWWSAMLNRKDNKKVVAPKYWITLEKDRATYDSKLHYPEQWIKI